MALRGGAADETSARAERWRVGMRGGHNASNVYAVDETRSAHDEETVCEVYGIAMHQTVEEVEASRFNAKGLRRARLIAAAPEMLEALTWIAAQEHLIFAECTLAEEIVARARAAIRKASAASEGSATQPC